MPTFAKLSDIVEAMESQGDEVTALLHKTTGEVYLFTDEEMQAAEEEEEEEAWEDYPEWQQPVIREARQYIDHPDEFLDIPTKLDLDEYRIMEEFCWSVENEDFQRKLLHAIQGKGAFGRFKDQLHRFNLTDAWYKHRNRAIRNFAQDWCRENDILLFDPAKLDKDCPFCKILAREIPSSIVYHDELCTAFMDIQPINPGHVLIVPNRHATLLQDIDPQLAGHLFKIAQQIDQTLRTTGGIECEGVNIFLADGQAAMQEVPHVHLHVFPRFTGDGFGLQFGPNYANKPDRSELDDIAEQIRLAM